MPTRPGLLDCVERYFALAPLPDAHIESAGPLDVPIGDVTWPYAARPRPGAGQVTAEDVRAAIALQRAAGLEPALEWIHERSPGGASLLGVCFHEFSGEGPTCRRKLPP